MKSIYIFAEHYPNPYKPQFDTEFAFISRSGYKFKIFVGGQYNSTIHPRVLEYSLHKSTYVIPTTLKTVPCFFLKIFKIFLQNPLQASRRFVTVFRSTGGMKNGFVRAFRAVLLPYNNPDVCYIHNIATANFVDFLKLIFPNCRLALYFHGGEVGGVKQITNENRIFSIMDVIITNTEFSKKQAISRGCDDSKIIVIPVSFDTSDYPDMINKKYFNGNVLQLISIGRLSDEKGLIIAFKAIKILIDKKVCNFKYTIIGRGTQEAELKNYVKKYHLENYIEFVGELDKEKVVNYLKKSDVLILPSVVTHTWAETQAAVVQEAMFMKLIVISTIAGGVPESISHVMKQFSVPTNDSESISLAILNILKLSQNEFIELGNTARDFAIRKFDIEINGPVLLKSIFNDF